LLLTATPHDGEDTHFVSLVELLDPSLVDGRGSLRGDRYWKHVVRRLKRHIKDPETGEPMFRERVVKPEPVEISEAAAPTFRKVQTALLTLVGPQLTPSRATVQSPGADCALEAGKRVAFVRRGGTCRIFKF
jgi:hypothetical protein